MPLSSHLPIYLSGAFAGIGVLVLLLSVLIGYAYRERMLLWHAGALASALLAQGLTQSSPRLSATLWVAQLLLSACAMRAATGTSGAMRRPAMVLPAMLVLFLLLTLIGLGLQLVSANLVNALLLPWAIVTGWYLLRAWKQSKPWIIWLALGQLALLVERLLWTSVLLAPEAVDPQIASLAALAVFGIATYVGMVWLSRLSAENALRVEARERTDPLTGLATPRVFFDRVDGALIRSRHMGYTCALLLIRVENIQETVAEQGLDNSEPVILAASRAIAAALRSPDSAARLASNRFGVMAEGIAEGMSSQLATQILANGLRAGQWGLQGSELQLQMAIIEIDPSDVKSAALLTELEGALRHMATQSGHTRIRTLPRISSRQPSSHI